MKRFLMLALVTALLWAGSARADVITFTDAKAETLEDHSPTGHAHATAEADMLTGAVSASGAVDEVLPEPVLIGRDFATGVAKLTAQTVAAANTTYTVTWTLDDLGVTIERHHVVELHPSVFSAAGGVFLHLDAQFCKAEGCDEVQFADLIMSESRDPETKTLSVPVTTPAGSDGELRVTAGVVAQAFVGGPGSSSANVTSTASHLFVSA